MSAGSGCFTFWFCSSSVTVSRWSVCSSAASFILEFRIVLLTSLVFYNLNVCSLFRRGNMLCGCTLLASFCLNVLNSVCRVVFVLITAGIMYKFIFFLSVLVLRPHRAGVCLTTRCPVRVRGFVALKAFCRLPRSLF